MGEAFRGNTGSGSVVVYTVPRDHALRLELLTFQLVTDATAGVHKAAVTFTDSTIGRFTARLRDLNEGGPSMTLTYTYGIGLNGSACVAVDGWTMTDALPETVLAPETVITVVAVNDSGTTIAGDAIQAVTLFGDMGSTVKDDPYEAFVVPGLLPGSAQD